MFDTKDSIEFWKTITSVIAPISTMLFAILNTFTEKKKEIKVKKGDTEETKKVFTIWAKFSAIGVIISAIISLFTFTLDGKLNRIKANENRIKDSTNQAKIDSIKGRSDSIYQRAITTSDNLIKSLNISETLSKNSVNQLLLTKENATRAKEAIELLGTTNDKQVRTLNKQDTLFDKTQELLYPLFPLKLTVSYTIDLSNLPKEKKIFFTNFFDYLVYDKPSKIPSTFTYDGNAKKLYYANRKLSDLEDSSKIDSTFKNTARFIESLFPYFLLYFYSTQLNITKPIVSDSASLRLFVIPSNLKSDVSYSLIDYGKLSVTISLYDLTFYNFKSRVKSLYGLKEGFLMFEFMPKLENNINGSLQNITLECGYNYYDRYNVQVNKSDLKKIKIIKSNKIEEIQAYILNIDMLLNSRNR